jgi:tRNA threonylcarbamoyladenosine biosynthesis protein TsaE
MGRPKEYFYVLTQLLPSEIDTLALGRRLAKQVRSGDVIALSGPLGAGKTALARGFIRQRLGRDVDVSSPTFALVQVYDQTTPAVWHFDLYRLDNPDDCVELGLDEALATGVCLIEWPEKAAAWLPRDRLDIALSADGSEDARMATLTPGPSWADRINQMPDLESPT